VANARSPRAPSQDGPLRGRTRTTNDRPSSPSPPTLEPPLFRDYVSPGSSTRPPERRRAPPSSIPHRGIVEGPAHPGVETVGVSGFVRSHRRMSRRSSPDLKRTPIEDPGTRGGTSDSPSPRSRRGRRRSGSSQPTRQHHPGTLAPRPGPRREARLAETNPARDSPPNRFGRRNPRSSRSRSSEVRLVLDKGATRKRQRTSRASSGLRPVRAVGAGWRSRLAAQAWTGCAAPSRAGARGQRRPWPHGAPSRCCRRGRALRPSERRVGTRRAPGSSRTRRVARRPDQPA